MTFSGIIGIVLGGINFFIICSALKGSSITFLQNEKGAFIIAFIICLVMCPIGITNMLSNRDFRVAGFLVGGIIGAAFIVMFVSVITENHVPILGSVRNSLIALLVLMSVKLAVSTVNIAWMTVGRGL